MNAAELLSHLVARGIARRVPARAGTGSVIAVRGYEMAVGLDPSESEGSIRARWKEQVGNRPVGQTRLQSPGTATSSQHLPNKQDNNQYE